MRSDRGAWQFRITAILPLNEKDSTCVVFLDYFWSRALLHDFAAQHADFANGRRNPDAPGYTTHQGDSEWENQWNHDHRDRKNDQCQWQPESKVVSDTIAAERVDHQIRLVPERR